MAKIETCLECGLECKVLGTHLKKNHKITREEYYIKWFKKDGDGNCNHCDEQTKWNEDKFYTAQ